MPPFLLESIARTESSLRPDVDPNPPKDGLGLMGMTYSTALSLGYQGSRVGLKDPAVSIELAAQYAAAIIARQGGLVLTDFYSEYNSGRPFKWQSSSEVAGHVLNFLKNVGQSLGMVISANTIDDAVAQLGNVTAAVGGSGAAALVIVAAILWLKGGKR